MGLVFFAYIFKKSDWDYFGQRGGVNHACYKFIDGSGNEEKVDRIWLVTKQIRLMEVLTASLRSKALFKGPGDTPPH